MKIPQVFHRCVVLILAFLPVREAVAATAQDAGAGDRGVGLALSGGGALGAAHVGVLKALEEMNIPIGYIAGTSMGAIIGGLYASGMPPAEIEDWIRNADWDFLLSDSLPREAESFRKKQRQFDLNQGIAFTVSPKKGLKLPAGLISGRNIMASLRQLTVPVRHIDDFDRLPIPFRAIATDIETGDLIVLEDGDLVEAMRSSMSIPALFTPQPYKDRLLADGGLANNLPVSIVQQMGADSVIAVKAGGELKKGADLDTASAMMGQLVAIPIERQTREEIARLRTGDVLIKMKLDEYGTTDFSMASTAIDVGYKETMALKRDLAAFAVSPPQFKQYLARHRVHREPRIMISYLRVRTPDGEFRHDLKKPVEFQLKNRTHFAPLQTMIGDLGELQKFEVADYEILGENGQYGLLVKAQETKTGPTDFAFGFGFGYSSADETDLGLMVAFRMTELNALGAAWETYLNIGNTTRVTTEWYQPLDWDRRFFVAAHGLFGIDYIDGRDPEGHELRFRQQDLAAGVDLGARLWQAGEFRIGYTRGFTRLSSRLEVPEEIPDYANLALLHADLTVDTLDAPSFATKGLYARGSIAAAREELGSSEDYTRFDGQIFRPFTFYKNTIVPRLSMTLSLDSDLPIYEQEPLGGFLNLSGLSRGSLFAENTALAELIYYRKLIEVHQPILRAIYGGVSIEAGDAWGDHDDFCSEGLTFGGSLFIGADTFLGDLYLGLGFAEDGNAAVYLQLGSPFGQSRHHR